jgi:hypothetical protein
MGSNENLENLLRSGGLKAEPPDRKECEGLMRSAVDRSLYWPHREQARSHIGSASYTKPLVGASLLAMASAWPTINLTVTIRLSA